MKLDLSRLQPEQIEALRVIAERATEADVRALKNMHAKALAAPEVRESIRLVTRILTAIGRAERAQQKGTQ